MRPATLLPLVLALAFGSGCSSPVYPVSAGMITGSIVARDVQLAIGDPPSIHVKESPAEECGTVFLLKPSTAVLRRTDDGRLVRASMAELTVGREVSVWARVVQRSCPGQSSAETVVVLPASP